VNEINSIALKMVVLLMAEEMHKRRCREMMNNLRKGIRDVAA